MHKFLLMFATLLLVSTATAFAAANDSEEGGDEEDEKTFECSDDPDVGRTCTCETGDGACGDMIEGGVCSSDIWCRETGSGNRYCICDWAPEARGGISRRPDAFSPGTENAPVDRNARDRRRSGRSASGQDDIVSPNNRTVDRQNEVVRARRGAGPASEATPEEEEDETNQNRPVRDHRR